MSPQSADRRWRRTAAWAGKAALLAFAAWLVLHLLSGLAWRDVAQRLATADRAWLGTAVAALVVRFVVWDQRWREALRRAGPLPRRWISLSALLAAAAANTITPTVRVVGGVLRGRWIARATGEPIGRAYGSVLFDQLAHQVVMTGVTVVAVIAAAVAVGRAGLALLLTAVALAATAAGVVWLRRRAGNRRTLLRRLAGSLLRRGSEGGRLHRVLAHGREALDVVVRLLGDPGLRWRALLLGTLFFVVNAGAQWLVFVALGSPVDPRVVLAVVALGTAAGILMGTPGGLGAAEAAMIAGFTAFGVDRLEATAAALLYRTLHYLVVLGLGLPCLAWWELAPERRPPGAPPPQAG